MTLQEKIWKVIRGLNSEFTVEEVAILVEGDSKYVGVYISTLVHAGYIRKTGRRREGKRSQPLYRLIKNTGPKAPKIRRYVYDPNLNQLMGGGECG
jgi:hypothetical protein